MTLAFILAALFQTFSVDNPAVSILGLDRVILTQHQIEPGEVYADSLWLPSSPEIQKALPAVLRYLEKSGTAKTTKIERQDCHEILDRLRSYKIQCVGKYAGGKKLIHFNFFSHTDYTYWKKNYVRVDDGGTSYWRIDVEVSTNRCFNFIVNGVA
jgi:hypothetical protein